VSKIAEIQNVLVTPTTHLIRIKYPSTVLKGLDTCYSATYMSKTRDQQRFTISEVAADWYEPMHAAAHYVATHCPR